MKRSTYFVVTTNTSEDAMAAELVLTLREGFPYTEVHGVIGDCLDRCDVKEHGRIHELEPHLLSFVKERVMVSKVSNVIRNLKPKLVFITGVSSFHEKIATFCKANDIKVHLFAPPHFNGWTASQKAWVKGCAEKVIGIYPGEEAAFSEAGIDFCWAGFPALHRLSQVKLRKEHICINESSSIITFLPGSDKRDLKRSMKKFSALAGELRSRADYLRFIVAAPAGFSLSKLSNLLGPIEEMSDGFAKWQGLEIAENMRHEMIFLANMTVSAHELGVLESLMLGTPAVYVAQSSKKKAGLLAHLHSIGVIPEIGHHDDIAGMANHIDVMIRDGEERQRFMEGMEAIYRHFAFFDQRVALDAHTPIFGRRGISRKARSGSR